jgi:hypothetical protein
MSGNPQEVTAGVGVGVGLGVGVGGGVTPAASPPPDRPDLISQSDIIPEGQKANTSVSIDGYAEKPEDRPGSTNDPSGLPVPISDELFTRRDPPHSPVESKRRTPPKAKRGTQCPEELTAEQWARVEKWRSKKHPEIPAASLPKIWEKHALWYISHGRTGADWVRSFYLWILRDLDRQPSATSATHRPPPPVWKGPQGPKFTDADPETIAKVLDESRKLRRKRKPEPKPPLAEDEASG